MTQAGSDSLLLQLVAPGQLPAGEPARFRFSARNRTDHALELYLRGRTATLDIVVAHARGETVWRRLEDEIIPAILHLRTLAPGETLELEAVWDQKTKDGRPVEPGEYTVRGLLLVEGAPLEAPAAPLRIVGNPSS